MPRPISEDLRRVIVRLYNTGAATYLDIVEITGVSRASVGRILRLNRTTKSVAPKPATGGPKYKLSEEDRALFRRLLIERPDATIEELTATWAEKRPEKVVSTATIWRETERAGFTLKKRRFVRSNWTTRT